MRKAIAVAVLLFAASLLVRAQSGNTLVVHLNAGNCSMVSGYAPGATGGCTFTVQEGGSVYEWRGVGQSTSKLSISNVQGPNGPINLTVTVPSTFLFQDGAIANAAQTTATNYATLTIPAFNVDADNDNDNDTDYTVSGSYVFDGHTCSRYCVLQGAGGALTFTFPLQ